MLRTGRNLFFLVFTASGFAGLIYESIWTHYLKLFLGHAAYAQTLVLAVFMGGLALGSWFSARYSKKWGNLLLGYALVEAIIGIFAVIFHPFYVQFLDLAHTRLIPGIGTPTAVMFFKWITASLFILPQSILLGMTFPLLTAGVIRKYPQDPGATVAMLYFTNSVGAAAGVLASGFLFIAWAGLPGTLIIAGLINIVVAAIVWLRVRDDGPCFEQPGEATKKTDANMTATYRALLVVAFLTGTSSFIYEIGWIRMLNLVLSSSTHAFELMLSAFITGLALGGLFVRRRIDRLLQPLRFLAFVQIAMGILALATLPLYGTTFDVMAWLIRNLEKSMVGYTIFNIISHGIALVIMLPATFCAGMTLPLITAALLREGHGEKSIGEVYAFNTLGCIAGILIAVHLAMPLLGLKGMIGLGAGIDIVLGLALAWWAYPSIRIPVILTAMAAAVLLLSMVGITFDIHKLVSGVYKTGKVLSTAEGEVVFHHDGKTATVSVIQKKNTLTIKTNGKPDASINLTEDEYSPDESTQIMLGVMPLVLHPNAKTAAVIGWGSGMTTNVLLSSQQLDRVDSVEIEPDMVKAARLFRPRVELAYTDPRSHIHIEDAKTYFSTYNKKYDIIISEPSNPWVSGVAGLFSEEFYGRMKDHLNPNGLLIQWLQLYEIDMPLVASVFEALSNQFADYEVYASNSMDILIIAKPIGDISTPDARVLNEKGLARELARVEINSVQDLLLRRIGNKRSLGPLFVSYGAPANSDYYPFLDLYAARTRFMKILIEDLTGNSVLPAVEMLEHQTAVLKKSDVSYSHYEPAIKIHLAKTFYEYIVHGRWKWDHPDATLDKDVRQYADNARQALSDCSGKIPQDQWKNGMFHLVAQNIIPYTSRDQLSELWKKAEVPSCWEKRPAYQQGFIKLLKAIDRRDAPTMAQYARQLLKEMPDAKPDLRAYILATGMLGDLAQGNAGDARLLWGKYGPGLDVRNRNSLLIRLLIAHAFNACSI